MITSSIPDRLQRLDGYLREDPGNAALLADACDAAIACGELERAEGYLTPMEQAGQDACGCLFRRARIALVRRQLPAAAALLAQVREQMGEHPVLVHDLGHVLLLQGAFAECCDWVQPWLDGTHGELAADDAGPLQVIWLRAMHRLQRVDDAMAWVHRQRAARALQPTACGVASLLALDAEDLALARELADAALAAESGQVEALVTTGTLALAADEAAVATAALQRALASNPDDGRTWSALGMASLKAGDLPLAQSQLERALQGIPAHIGTWHALGWVRLLRGDREGALAAFASALEADRNFAETHGALGLVLGLQGQADESARHLAVADRLDPANVSGRYARAVLSGMPAGGASLQRLARRLLNRPGLFGGTLADAVLSQVEREEARRPERVAPLR